MQAAEWIRRHGGIAHRRDLEAAGWGKDALAGLPAIGRCWVHTGGAPPALVRAAALRGRLACVSAAQHLDLQLLHEPDRLHLWVAPSGEHPASPDLRLHRSKPLLPVPRGTLIEPVQNMLAHIAGCLPEDEALVVWENALHRRLLTLDELRRTAWAGPRQRRLAAVASDRSDSLLETLLAHQLRAAGIPYRQQVPVLGRRVDFVVGGRDDRGIVVQTDGFDVHQAAQRRADIAHDGELVLRGRHVLRFDFAQVVEHRVVPVVLRAIAQGLDR
ncbi:MAG: DUF559 domain-containing protein [Microbacteriaceae bacterium]|nr:DUF559 domain-containing protein [Microbacteriaceae bacterium]